jgi:hypothetical protein
VNRLSIPTEKGMRVYLHTAAAAAVVATTTAVKSAISGIGLSGNLYLSAN